LAGLFGAMRVPVAFVDCCAAGRSVEASAQLTSAPHRVGMAPARAGPFFAIILFGDAAFRALAYIRHMIFVIVLRLARSGSVVVAAGG